MRHFWVDRIVELELGKRAVGVKNVALSEDVFQDHFPGNPVLPGIYLIEGLAQTAGVLLTRTTADRKFALMNSIERVRFSAFVRPGDTVRLSVEIQHLQEESARVQGTAETNGRPAAAARLTFRLLDPNQIIPTLYQPLWTHSLSLLLGEYGGNERD